MGNKELGEFLGLFWGATAGAVRTPEKALPMVAQAERHMFTSTHRRSNLKLPLAPLSNISCKVHN